MMGILVVIFVVSNSTHIFLKNTMLPGGREEVEEHKGKINGGGRRLGW